MVAVQWRWSYHLGSRQAYGQPICPQRYNYSCINDRTTIKESVLGIVRRIKNKNDLLKIALFDIWLSNEDRTTNNYNLLLQAVKGGYSILYIIDNTEIFNSSMAYSQSLEQIAQCDSILNSDLSTLVFKNNSEIVREVDVLLKEFPIFTKSCQNNLKSILSQVPEKWHINLQSYETKINTIFTEDWLKICTHTFREYIQTSIIHKP